MQAIYIKPDGLTIIMKNASSKKDTKEMYMCCGHNCGYGMIAFGIFLIAFGLFWAKYNLPTALILIGGILVVKGIIITLFKKSELNKR